MGVRLTYVLLLLIFCCVWFIGWQYFRTRSYITIGKTLVEHAEPYEQHPQNPNLRILIVGDSSGVGVGAATNTLSVAGRIGSQFQQADITNISVSGAKISDAYTQIQSVTSSYDIIMIHVGGNDIVRFTPLATIRKNLKQLLTSAEQKGTHIIILHGGDFGSVQLLPIGTRWVFSARTKKVRDIYIEETRKRSTQYIDMLKDPSIDPFYIAPHTYYAADLFHPSEFGYDAWYTDISLILIPLIRDT